MKRVLSFILCAMICLSACACKVTSVTDVGQAPISETDTEPEENSLIIVDNEYITQTVVWHGMDKYDDYCISTIVENKSDKDLAIFWENCVVNGWMCSCWEWEELAPGASMAVDITLYSYDLEVSGIDTIDEIGFNIVIEDSDDWLSDPLVNEIFYIYPTGLSADEVKHHTRQPQENEFTVLDENGYTVIIENPRFDDDYYLIDCYFANSTEKTVSSYLENLIIDGWSIDIYGAGIDMLPGSQYRETISLDKETLSEIGVSEPNEISFELSLEDVELVRQDPDSYGNILVMREAIYPTGLTADQIVSPERTPVDGEVVVVDNEYITLIIIGYEFDDMWGYVFDGYCLNKTDMPITLDIDEVSIDGKLSDAIWMNELPSSTQAYVQIETIATEEADNPSEFEFRLRVYANDDYDQQLMFERVSYNP